MKLPLVDVVSMQTRQANLEGSGEIRLRRLVKEALRMRPSRLIVGEVRQEECLDLLIALNSGLPGMCSIHANSAREAVTKLCTLPLLAGENVSHRFVVPTVATSVDVVVHLAMDVEGQRRVREIVALPGRIEGDVVEVADIFATRGHRLVRAEGWPPHRDRFMRAGYDLARLLDPRANDTSVAVHSAQPGDARHAAPPELDSPGAGEAGEYRESRAFGEERIPDSALGHGELLTTPRNQGWPH